RDVAIGRGLGGWAPLAGPGREAVLLAGAGTLRPMPRSVIAGGWRFACAGLDCSRLSFGVPKRNQRSHRTVLPCSAARWAAFTAAGSCRANDTNMPSTPQVSTNEVPPLEMNGSGMPETGSKAVTYPKLIKACQ